MAGRKDVADVMILLVQPATVLAYLWMVGKHPFAAASLYGASILFGLLMGAFRELSQWPTMALVSLVGGALLVLLGYSFSFVARPGYWLWWPVGIYVAIMLPASYALRDFSKS